MFLKEGLQPNNGVFAALPFARPLGVTKEARGKNSAIRPQSLPRGTLLKFQCSSRKACSSGVFAALLVARPLGVTKEVRGKNSGIRRIAFLEDSVFLEKCLQLNNAVYAARLFARPLGVTPKRCAAKTMLFGRIAFLEERTEMKKQQACLALLGFA